MRLRSESNPSSTDNVCALTIMLKLSSGVADNSGCSMSNLPTCSKYFCSAASWARCASRSLVCLRSSLCLRSVKYCPMSTPMSTPMRPTVAPAIPPLRIVPNHEPETSHPPNTAGTASTTTTTRSAAAAMAMNQRISTPCPWLSLRQLYLDFNCPVFSN